MKVLIVNDDGIESAGLAALKEGLEGEHEVWVCAPESERSGASHSLTFSEPVRTRKISSRTLSVNGTPVDCVLAAFEYFLPGPPDVVLSGINIGANQGADIIYSGTVGAARQAVILGAPGIAVSLDTFTPPFRFDTAVDFVSKNLADFIALWNSAGGRKHLLNINVPNVENFSGSVVVAPPGKLAYSNSIRSTPGSNGDMLHSYVGHDRIGIQEEIETDIDLLADRNIVVTPVKVYPEIYDEGEIYTSHSFTT
jgi:5'-nucleotidase